MTGLGCVPLHLSQESPRGGPVKARVRFLVREGPVVIQDRVICILDCCSVLSRNGTGRKRQASRLPHAALHKTPACRSWRARALLRTTAGAACGTRIIESPPLLPGLLSVAATQPHLAGVFRFPSVSMPGKQVMFSRIHATLSHLHIQASSMRFWPASATTLNGCHQKNS